MPERRYIRTFENGQEVPGEPYDVSNEQLAQEAEALMCQGYLSKSPDVITQPQIWWLLRYFGRLHGFNLG